MPGKSGVAASTGLFNYSSVEIKAVSNHLNIADTRDIMPTSAPVVSVPISSRVSVDNQSFSTTASGTIPVGDATSAPIATQAELAGTTGNILAGAIDTLAGKGTINTAITGVEHVKNDSAYSGGENEESDADRAVRFQVFVQGLAKHNVIGIQSAVLNIQGIKSVSVRNNFPAAGVVTVVADDGTGNLSGAQITEIQKVLDGDPDDLVNFPGVLAAGITANVEAPTVIAVNVVISVFRVGSTSDETEINTFVQSAIENYINTRKLGDDVVLNKIREIAMSAHPAVYDVTITTPVANTSISASELSRTGSGTGATVDVTVVTLESVP